MWVLQANYGYGHGYEDECVEETRAEALQRLKEYRENAPKYSYRIKRYHGQEQYTWCQLYRKVEGIEKERKIKKKTRDFQIRII